MILRDTASSVEFWNFHFNCYNFMIFLLCILHQRFSNCGLRTICGPRGLPLWSMKKYRRKIKINCISHYSWKSQSLEMTHGNHLSLFLPVLTFNEIYYPTHLPISTLPSATNEGCKALWTRCFSPSFPNTSGASPVTQSRTTQIHKRTKIPSFSCIYDILNSFAYNQSAHCSGHVL